MTWHSASDGDLSHKAFGITGPGGGCLAERRGIWGSSPLYLALVREPIAALNMTDRCWVRRESRPRGGSPDHTLPPAGGAGAGVCVWLVIGVPHINLGSHPS